MTRPPRPTLALPAERSRVDRPLRTVALLAASIVVGACSNGDAPTGPRSDLQVDMFRAPTGDPGTVGLQLATTDARLGTEAYVYGPFSSAGIPQRPTAIAIGRPGSDSVTVALLDAAGMPSFVYQANRTDAGKAAGVVQLVPAGPDSLRVHVYDYNWAGGAGRLALTTLVTRAAGGVSTRVEFIDTTSSAAQSARVAGAVRLASSALSAGRGTPTARPAARSLAVAADGTCDDYARALANIGAESLPAATLTTISKAGLGLMFVGAVVALPATTVTTVIGSALAAFGGYAAFFPALATKLVLMSADGLSPCANADERLDPSTRPNPVASVISPNDLPYAGGIVSVRDNGTLADDAFAVAVDGAVLGATTIGGANTLPIGALRPGTRQLTVQAITAPDNVGTYEVILGGGLTFGDGTLRRSGTVPQGGAVTFGITVPTTLRTTAPLAVASPRPNATLEAR